MTKRIVILEGHPDANRGHLCHALADAYAAGAAVTGHQVRRIDVARLDFPLLRTAKDWQDGAVPSSLAAAQEAIGWADHLVLIYPLWLGTMPALFKAFLEQTLRPGFAVDPKAGLHGGRLKGKSARVVVTMGMPALFYRLYFRAHSLKSLERNILKFCGIKPIRESLYGMVDTVSAAKRAGWLARMTSLGTWGV